MIRPLCFVLMPFGTKLDTAGTVINFDAIYRELVLPAIHDAGLEPQRADEELMGDIIHETISERLLLCEYAVADLTAANPNVYYELGVRMALRPGTTVLLFSSNSRVPFDVSRMRAISYRVTPEGVPEQSETAYTKEALVKRLQAASEDRIISPIYQNLDGVQAPKIDREKSDVLSERMRYSTRLKEQLASARRQGLEAVREMEAQMGPLEELESGVIIDLFLSYRAVSSWADMVRLARQMPRPLADTIVVQEQLALALNRSGQSEEAKEVINSLLRHRGPSSETYGILGRIYKDSWEQASRAGNNSLARLYLKQAIEAYLRGFETDWRDAYPGINAVTLMELQDEPDARRESLIPVVSYAVERRIAASKPDYWDYATLLELSVLARNEQQAKSALSDALSRVRESWEAETTLRNLRLIREARERRHEVQPWMMEIEDALSAMSGSMNSRATYYS